MVLVRLYVFFRKGGLSRRRALARAWVKAWEK
jgi:hypothetical protein